MQIEHNLPQFSGEAALVLVCGVHVSKIYVAKDGTISEAAIIETPTPRYSDKEGVFGNAGKGTMFARGGPLELPKESMRADFLKQIEQTLNTAFPDRNVASVYLFAPAQMLTMISRALPSWLKEAPIITFEGNFVKRHPFTLLGEIKRLDDVRNPAPENEEVKKILSKSRT